MRKLEGFPLYVTSSLADRDIVRGWLWYMAGHLVFGVPATLFLVVLILLAMRTTNGALCRSRTAGSRRSEPAAIAKDGSGRTIDRRRRARLQQSPDHHPRQSADWRCGRPRKARQQRLLTQCLSGRGPRRRTDQAPAGVFAQPAARSAADRRQPAGRRHVRPARPHARRNHRDRNRARRRAVADRGRQAATGSRAAQPRDQRARRDAGRRQADHRNRQCVSR